MQRRGLTAGSGHRGYYNVLGSDPSVHAMSARGIKQPQKTIQFVQKDRPSPAKCSVCGLIVERRGFGAMCDKCSGEYWQRISKGGKYPNVEKFPKFIIIQDEYKGKITIADTKSGRVFDIKKNELKKYMPIKLGGKCGGKKPNVYLEDDGTLDTVVSVNGHTIRFDTEYASQFRNKKGEITKAGWQRLKKEAIEAYEMEQDYPSNEQSGKCGGKKLPIYQSGDLIRQDLEYAGRNLWRFRFPDKGTISVYAQNENEAIKKIAMKMKGGKCSPSDLKYGTAPDSQFSKSALKAGIKVETEHTKSKSLAKAIAKAHLKEMPNYYKKLKRMEKGGKWLGKLNDVPTSIGVIGHRARYVGTEVEDKNGKWDDNYWNSDGYWVIHRGEYHDVYFAPETIRHKRVR